MDWKGLIGKRIFVVLKSGHNYTGEVTSCDEDFITIIDKFNVNVTLNTDEIKVLKEGEKWVGQQY